MTSPSPSRIPDAPARAPLPPPSGPFPMALVLGLLAYTAVLFAVRLLGPANLTDNDQERPASYVLDAVRNGHWIVQYDWTGDITSKPPAYTWLAAGITALLGGPSLFALYLPCALAMFGAAALIAREAARAFDTRTALWAGLFVLANPLAAKLVALARTDPLFTLTVTWTAVLAWRAWRQGHGWTWAWFAAACATLTKGPLGCVLGFVGLTSWFWERRHRSGTGTLPGRGHLAGLALWVGLCFGWFYLAWLTAGDALVRKMLGAELVRHAVGEPGTLPGAGLVLAPAYYLGRFLPWSVISLVGLVWAIVRPESSDAARGLQRFCAAWLVGGLAVFGLASHQRGDLIAPLLPAGALLAAVPAARWTARWSWRTTLATAVGVALVMAFVAQFEHTRRNREVFDLTRQLAEAPGELVRQGKEPALLRHADAPYALQFFLGTMHPALDWDAAALHLRASPRHSLAVSRLADLEARLGPDAPRLRTLVAWPPTAPHQGRIVALDPPPNP